MAQAVHLEAGQHVRGETLAGSIGPAADPATFGGGTADLRRHPLHGRGLAAPIAMPGFVRTAMRSLIVVIAPSRLVPTETAAREATVDALEAQIRRLMAYMPTLTAIGLMLLFVAVDQSPRWALRSWRRMGRLPLADARHLLHDLAGSSFSPIRTMLYAVRGICHAVVFDTDQAWEAIGYEPRPWLRSRIALRQQLLAGQTPSATDQIAPVPGVAPLPETTHPEVSSADVLLARWAQRRPANGPSTLQVTPNTPVPMPVLQPVEAY